MIVYKNVSCGYAGRNIISNASFSIPKGVIASVIGRNGEGKTTLVSCMNGGVRYTGDIWLGGKNIREMSAAEKARKAAFLPQYLVDTPFTVEELTAIGRRPYLTGFRKLSDTDREQIERAMKITGVAHLKSRRVLTLSGGEKQRAYLSMIIAQNTDIIVLDEAFSNLDASVENEMYALFRTFTREMGKTIVIIMHDLTKCVNNTDQAMILENSRIIADMPARELAKTDLIETVFGVEKGILTTPNGEKRIVYL